MTRTAIGLGLLAAGVILLGFALNAGDSFASEVSEAFEDAPSDKAITLYVLAGVTGVAGLAVLLTRRR